MDNFEYLNQISQSTRPAAPPKKSARILKSPIFRFTILGVIAIIAIIIIIGFVNSINNKPNNLAKQVYLRSSTINSVISQNNSLVKSSQLRAINLSLMGVISNSTRELATYLVSVNGENALAPDQDLLNAETAVSQQVNYTLQNARLNGILDRIYPNELNLQVRLLMSFISELVARTNDAKLKEIATNFYNNLSLIQESLETYSSAAS